MITLLGGGVTAWSELNHQRRTAHRTFWQSSNPIRTVEVSSGSAQVLVEAGAPDRVTVKEDLGWVVSRPSVSTQVVGSTLRVAVSCGGPIPVIGCSVALDIQVPTETEVHTQNSSGGTLICGVSGEIRARTTSGRLQLEGVSGPVWAKSTSGNITARELGAPVVDAASSSGQVDLGFALPPGSVTATTVSGAVVVAVPGKNTRYRVGGHTLSHSWSVDPDMEDSSSDRRIDITTMSGPVTVTSVDSGSALAPSSASATEPAPGAPEPGGSAPGKSAPGAPTPGKSAAPAASSQAQP
ncbi:DUF4097 family beta strand repeat-containing protein [Kitasatospora sp. HPMI-4]|uniref:DUF4097 family beta strand repeat-containing protein n=1 Tax=Kitasatospora sp. HPMI-4 TaxID=3448443 RepID=UPI003F1A3F34